MPYLWNSQCNRMVCPREEHAAKLLEHEAEVVVNGKLRRRGFRHPTAQELEDYKALMDYRRDKIITEKAEREANRTRFTFVNNAESVAMLEKRLAEEQKAREEMQKQLEALTKAAAKPNRRKKSGADNADDGESASTDSASS